MILGSGRRPFRSPCPAFVGTSLSGSDGIREATEEIRSATPECKGTR